MKTGSSIKKICSECKIFYRFQKLYRLCNKKKRHKKRQK